MNYDIIHAVMVGHTDPERGWVETLAFSDVFIDRQDAEKARSEMLKTSVWSILETNVKQLRIIPKQGDNA